MPENPHDLSRLNPIERRVLLLLAEGHTAKSIATELDTSPAAVNERLREARRKTGVGSSRELARLLKSQENRDEQMGVENAALEVTVPALSARPWRSRTGVFAMIGILIVAAASAAALVPQAATPDAVDPLIGRKLEKSVDPADLHRRVRAEPRDASWAPRMESMISARLMSMSLIGKDGNVLRVTCGSTLCEIGGTVIAPESKAEREDQNSLFGQTIKNLQVSPLTDDLQHLGLKMEAGTFTSGQGAPDRTVFLIYYSRA